MSIRCAVCGSERVITEIKKEGYNQKKGIIGAALFGLVGAIAGTSGNEVTYYHCGDCGQVLNKCMSKYELMELDFALQTQDKSSFLDRTHEMMKKYPNAGWNNEEILKAESDEKISELPCNNEKNNIEDQKVQESVNDDQKFEKKIMKIATKYKDKFTLDEIIKENDLLSNYSKVRIAYCLNTLSRHGFVEMIEGDEGIYYRFVNELPDNYFPSDYFQENCISKNYSENSNIDNITKEKIRFEEDERKILNIVRRYKKKFTAEEILKNNASLSEYPTIRIYAILHRLSSKGCLEESEEKNKRFFLFNKEHIKNEILNNLVNSEKTFEEIKNANAVLKYLPNRMIFGFCQELIEDGKIEGIVIEKKYYYKKID